MIAEETPGLLVMNVGGVYYDIRIPATDTPIPLEASAGAFEIHVIHHITQDNQILLGFPSREHKELAKLLIDKVAGIGPAVALSICGGMDTAAFKSAVVAKDEKTLAKCKGVGPKTAKRIITELEEAFIKMGVVGVWEEQVSGKVSPAVTDAILGLASLGIKKTDAKMLVEAASIELGPDAEVTMLVRLALQKSKR